MAKDLTSSQVDRQNILNNDVALPEIQKAVNIKCIIWNDSLYLTKDMVANFFSVDVRTIERYISKNTDELESNGYAVLKGKKLQEFLEVYESTFATDINVGRKIRALSVFDFRAFLNIPESVKFHFYKNKPISVVIFYRLHTNYNQSYRSKGHTTPLNFNNQFIMTY